MARDGVAHKQLATLQAGRGIAAVLVVLFHASKTIFQTPAFWPDVVFYRLFDFGHAGVAFFFVLSGFIILSAHHAEIGSPSRLRAYLAKRFIRVYPTYWIVLAPVVAIYLVMPQASKSGLADHSVIANSFALIGASPRSSLAVAWTLFHEVLFYLAFALWIWNRRLGACIMALWFSACLALALCGVHATYQLSSINLLFPAGMIVWWITDRHKAIGGAGLALAGATLFVGTGLAEVYAGAGLIATIGYGLGSAICITGCVGLERGHGIRVPKTARLIGDASYSIYLVHYPALSIAARIWIETFGARALPAELTFVALVASVIALGVLFHLVVERPVLSRGRRLLLRRQSSRINPAYLLREVATG